MRCFAAAKVSRNGIEHETGAATYPDAIGDGGPPGRLARQLKRERCLPVRCPGPTVAAMPPAQSVRSADVQVSARLREEVDARLRHVAGQGPICERQHGKQALELWRERVDQRSEFWVHPFPPFSDWLSHTQSVSGDALAVVIETRSGGKTSLGAYRESGPGSISSG